MIKLYFVISAFIFSPFANANCETGLRNESTAGYYSVGDAQERILYVTAWVSDQRQLRLNISTRSRKNKRNPHLRGRDQFDKILQHFDGQFDEIFGLWAIFNVDISSFDGAVDERAGDNLMAFNRAVRDGLPLEEAAFQTWTGRQAKRHGYEQVRFEQLRGAPGNYFNVHAIFSKTMRGF